MKIKHTLVAALVLGVFMCTNVASAYSAADVASLRSQIEAILAQLYMLVDQQTTLVASVTANSSATTTATTTSKTDAVISTANVVAATSTTIVPTTSTIPLGTVIVNTVALNVRGVAGVHAAYVGTQPAGSSGVITEGPFMLDGYSWYRVDYSTGVDGWSTGSVLRVSTDLPDSIGMYIRYVGSVEAVRTASTTRIAALADCKAYVAVHTKEVVRCTWNKEELLSTTAVKVTPYFVSSTFPIDKPIVTVSAVYGVPTSTLSVAGVPMTVGAINWSDASGTEPVTAVVKNGQAKVTISHTYTKNNTYKIILTDLTGKVASDTISITNVPVPSVPSSTKPNILFVLTDDLDMSLMDKLPRLKSIMTDNGMTFDNSFTSLALCCPSRAASLCGQYAHNNGIFTNDSINAAGIGGGYDTFKKLGDETKTMAVWLKAAGYRTALMGKYLNGYSADAGTLYDLPPGWSEWAVPINGNPYSLYNYTLNTNGAPEKHYLTYCSGKKEGQFCPVSYSSSTVADREDHFMTNVITKKAEDFMTRSAASNTPFFLYLAPFTPHNPSTPAPRYESLLNDRTWKAAHPYVASPSFNEADISDKPSWLKDNAGFLTTTDAVVARIYQRRLISMYAVEDMLTDLIATLKKNNQLDNTYIVFTSDNGFHVGEHRLVGGKMTEFDTDLRVPLIIRGPQVKPGSHTADITANVDLAPTFAALAGLDIPATVDGRSFRRTLLGGISVPRQALLLEHEDPASAVQIKTLANATAEPRDTETQNAPISGGEFVTKYVGLRTARYTYIHYAKNDEQELYDNVVDPHQLVNIASSTSSVLLGKMRAWADALSTCKGYNCRRIEAESRI